MTGSPTDFPHTLHAQVIRALHGRQLLQPGQRVLVAVSGGPDSVALLAILHQLAPAWDLSLTVVHCNYGLRGAESEGDASFVTALCRRLKLPCLIKPVTMGRREAGASSSLQARARESRYRLFREVAAELGAARVALGHTANDQAETVLLRMLRGAGLRGLAGMPPIRERLFVRPLLSVSRQDILSYLEAVGWSYRTDSSNAKSIYLRNRVRHELLPVMQALAPAAIRLLARQADILREDDRVLNTLAARRLARIIRSRDSTSIMMDRAALLKHPAALQRRMLRQALQTLSPSTGMPRSDVLLSMLASLASRQSGGAWEIGPVTVACEQDQVRLCLVSPRPPAGGMVAELRSPVPASEDVAIDSLPSTIAWRWTGEGIRLCAVTRRRGLLLLEKPSSAMALLDADRLSWPVTIRSWRRGDWFVPIGMSGRRKKLQDYFTDAKLGRSVRQRIPLLVSRDGIVWIVGERVDARFAATRSTTRFVLARVAHLPRRKGVF
ncbi:MAG: tRNA lysidine(34) synthetase TilS [Nitrospira sp.]|nr:tRNA lysidine(34) synthetase TilS [Nitrospira sp.]